MDATISKEFAAAFTTAIFRVFNPNLAGFIVLTHRKTLFSITACLGTACWDGTLWLETHCTGARRC